MNTEKKISSIDGIREQIVKLIKENGRSQTEVAKLFGIPRSTVKSMVRKFDQSGEIKCGIRGGSRIAVFSQELEHQIMDLVNDNQTITLNEFKTKLNLSVSLTTIWRWLKSMNITWKMTRPITEQRNSVEVIRERLNYVRWYNSLNPVFRLRNLIFIDESPFNLNMFRSHSWAIKGRTPNPIVRNSRGPNVTMMLAISCQNIIHCEAISSSVDGTIFRSFLTSLRTILGDEEDFCLVMDNVNFHHSHPEYYDEYPYEIKHLPRYSPFLNPIEEVFSQIKNGVRRDVPPNGSIDLHNRMREACTNVSAEHLSNYFMHSESFFETCLREEPIGRE